MPIKWNPLGFQTMVTMDHRIEYWHVASREFFHQARAKPIHSLDYSRIMSHTAASGLKCALGGSAGADDQNREAEIPRLYTASFFLARTARHSLLRPWT
jgi:hypothetical protein